MLLAGYFLFFFASTCSLACYLRLALLADQRPQQEQQQQQQQQQNNQNEEVPSRGDQQRRQQRQIIEDWEYMDNLVVVTPTPET